MIQLPKHILQRRIFTEKSYSKVTNGSLTALENMDLLSKDEQSIDVGAAAGIMSTFFAKKTKHVHAYEPSPSFAETEKLKQKFNNVTTYNLAVSNFEGKETFFIDDRRLSQNGFLNPGWGKPVEVNVVKLDNQKHSNIGLIKIDTEGTELDVIKGADTLIKSTHPTLMVEIWDQNTPDPGLYFKHLNSLGYKMYWYWTVKKKIMHCATVDDCVRDVRNKEYPSDADFIFVHESRLADDYTTRLISPVTI
tara:strand:+ start:4089 stop:4835 length:747 start_codon:yes stop_codon:yes gene_type:complete